MVPHLLVERQGDSVTYSNIIAISGTITRDVLLSLISVVVAIEGWRSKEMPPHLTSFPIIAIAFPRHSPAFHLDKHECNNDIMAKRLSPLLLICVIHNGCDSRCLLCMKDLVSEITVTTLDQSHFACQILGSDWATGILGLH